MAAEGIGAFEGGGVPEVLLTPCFNVVPRADDDGAGDDDVVDAVVVVVVVER